MPADELPLFWRWLEIGQVPPGYKADEAPHLVRWAVNTNRHWAGEYAVRGLSGRWHSLVEAIDMGWLRKVPNVVTKRDTARMLALAPDEIRGKLRRVIVEGERGFVAPNKHHNGGPT